MKIQKGIVKYKDRNDIVCTYGVTDDGRQYYFLDETDSKKLANGNRIATTALVEAIDPMVKASNVGVIDNDGNVIVMFDNRSIKPINDEIILVEKAEPVSQSVIDANALRSDPLSATKLVSTPATIKDRLNATMGGEGRYVFNDQFSEATLCDINGNNLLNDELYSFIAMTNDKIYLSKNTSDSVINELPITSNVNVQDAVNAPDVLDVGNTVVDQSVVENALTNSETVMPENGEVASQEVNQEVTQENAVEAVESVVGNEVVSQDAVSTGEALPSSEGLVEEVMPYDDEISTVFEENNAPSNEISDSAGFELPTDLIANGDTLAASGVTADTQVVEEVMPYDDNISTVVAEDTGVVALGNEVVEDVMPYDDNISTVVAEDTGVVALGNEVVEDVMPYDDNISTIVPENVEENVASAVDDVASNESNDNSIEVENNDNKEINDSTGFELPTDLVANDELNSNVEEEAFVPPVVEEEPEDVVIPAVSAEEIASAIDTKEEVVTDVVSENTSLDVFKDSDESDKVIPFDSEVVEEQKELEDDVVEDVASPSNEDVGEVPFSSELYTSSINNEELSDNFSYPSNNYQSDVGNFNDSANYVSSYNKPIDISYDSEYFDRKPVEAYGSEKYSLTGQYPRYDNYDSVFKSSMMKPDRIVPTNDYYDSFGTDYLKPSSDNSSIMNDVARSMTELMRQNKEQKGTIIQYQEKLDSVEAQRRILSEKYNDQTLRVENLSNKLRTLDDASTRLESKNQLLESRIRDQEKIIAAQERELNTLRPQLEGRQDLIKILADAKALLGTDDDYQDDNYYGRRVA